ncbi:Guanylate kinase [Posidoniimonas polymericola]|uniref:Guanylate kinase n=1 Tax=Posidoniimonas polymericola TaxID=2528002 RepID=A0A5C5YPZ7_9BACT|nr:guanylate kinase [Posidoniimonas polymericola]TWT76943.1 Guanylate kinase [Posidoniimonas polymericola]
MSEQPGKLVIISGPSGVGKSTIVPLVLSHFRGRLAPSISATTRPPRPGEVDGRNYHFLRSSEFRRRLDAGEFLESVEVFGRGHWYGTLAEEVLPRLHRGVWVMLEIDVDGTRRVLEQYPQALTIFIEPSSMHELERRLRARKTDAEEAIERRLAVAREEMQRAGEYRFRIVNDTIEGAVAEICSVLQEQGLKPSDRTDG